MANPIKRVFIVGHPGAGKGLLKFWYQWIAYLAMTFGIVYASSINSMTPVQENLANLEKTFDGRIGVYAINTDNQEVIAYRADERFPVQSTMKLISVGALFKASENDPNVLQEKIHYTQNDLIFWHPITGKYLNMGMTLGGLAEATMTYSDNPAANLIIKQLGGPEAITDFAHSIGNESFNLEHYEGNLNSNPNNTEDSSTPHDMAISVEKLLLGNGLTPSQKALLITWMQNNTTAYKRIRAGVPIGWTVADKTGSGDYGIANDIGILWSPLCKPIVLAIYTAQNQEDAKKREDIIASTTSIIFDEFSKQDRCFEALNS